METRNLADTRSTFATVSEFFASTPGLLYFLAVHYRLFSSVFLILLMVQNIGLRAIVEITFS